MDYIKLEDAINHILNHAPFSCSADFFDGQMDCVNQLKSLPTADVVEVKHGEWFLLDECANEGVYCSVCNKKVYRTEYANQKIKSNYCPNCGAKMGEERK